MLLDGNAYVHWTEHRSTGKSSYVVVYSEKEQYINSKTIFIEKDAHNDLYLEVGEYTYPFKIILPDGIPSSFYHEIGKIGYTLKSTVDIPWAFDKHTIRSFTLINPLDLNKLPPTLRQPYGVSETKILCCGCCSSDPITVTFSTLKTGFVPGEIIVSNVNIDNRSNREVKKITLKLVQELNFTGSSRELIVKTTKVRKCFRNIVEMNFTQIVPPKTNQNLEGNTRIIIPSIAASSNGISKIIVINYLLVFTFKCSGSLSKDISIPITIGTIPFETTYIPSYEECFNEITPEIAEPVKGEIIESDLSTFKPLYPYYKDFSLETK